MKDYYTAKRIAAMIQENVRALNSGKITSEQFSRVNRATWELADRGQQCIIGSPASRRCLAVSRALNPNANI